MSIIKSNYVFLDDKEFSFLFMQCNLMCAVKDRYFNFKYIYTMHTGNFMVIMYENIQK